MKDLWQSHDYSGNFGFPKGGIILWQFREKDEDKKARVFTFDQHASSAWGLSTWKRSAEKASGKAERLKSVRSDSRPLQTEYEGALYHVIGRGNERKRIFAGEDDHTRFLERDRTDRGKLDRFALVKREVSRNLHLNDLDHDMNLFNAL